MPQINRIRVNNVKYNFGTQMYDDFVMRFSGRNTLYDLANGGGKSVLMLLLMQNLIPNCTLDDKQPVEKLFEGPGASTVIHSLIEWKLDECDRRDGFRFMTTGFCARKSSDSGNEENSGNSGIDYFNYCIFYKGYGPDDIVNLPLSTDDGRITYNGLKAYLRDLGKKDLGKEVFIFDRKGDYQSFISRYGLYESQWEIIRGINKTEGHVRAYFENTYKTTRKVIEDLFIEEIIEKSYNNRVGAEASDNDDMAQTLMDIRDRLSELSRKKKERDGYTNQAALLREFSDKLSGLDGLYAGKKETEKKLSDCFAACRKALSGEREKTQSIENKINELGTQYDEYRRLASAAEIEAEFKELFKLDELIAETENDHRKLSEDRDALRDALRKYEICSDYEEYVSNRKKLDETKALLKASQSQNDEEKRLSELAAAKSVFYEKKMKVYEMKKTELSETSEKLADEYEHALREREELFGKMNILKGSIDELKLQLSAYSGKITEYLSECNILSDSQLSQTEKENDAELNRLMSDHGELSKRTETIDKELFEAGKEAALRRACTDRYSERCEDLKNRLCEAQKKQDSVSGLMKVYGGTDIKGTLTLMDRLFTETVSSICSEKKQSEALEAYCESIKNHSVPDYGTSMKNLLKYLKEHYGDVISGKEYIERLDGNEAAEAVRDFPLLPYVILAGDSYTQILADDVVKGFDLEGFSVPIIPMDSRPHGDELCWAYKDYGFIFDDNAVKAELMRVSDECEIHADRLRRLEDKARTIREDMAVLEALGECDTECINNELRELEGQFTDNENSLNKLEERILGLSEEKAALSERLRENQAAVAEKEKKAELIKKAFSASSELNSLSERLKDSEKEFSDVKKKYVAAGEKLSDRERRLSQCSQELESLKALSEQEEAYFKENYMQYLTDDATPAPGLSEEETDAEAAALRKLISGNTKDIESLRELLSEYDRMVKKSEDKLRYDGVSVEEAREMCSDGKLSSRSLDEMMELKKKIESAENAVKDNERQAEAQQAGKNRIEGGIEHEISAHEEHFGKFERMSFDDPSRSAAEFKSMAADVKNRISGLQRELKDIEAGSRNLIVAERDIERILKNSGIGIPEEDYVPETKAEDIEVTYQKAQESYYKLRQQESTLRSEFLREKTKLAAELEKNNAFELAEELRRDDSIPDDCKSIDSLRSGIEDTCNCIVLERDRIEKSMRDMEQIRQNFEERCLQICANIRAELDRLPGLSAITLDGGTVPIVTLSIPYVKEEELHDRMALYIDDTVAGAETFDRKEDQLKYIKGRLSWKKLFSVTVTDMNSIRLCLYKREHIKDRSRYLKYEEAVGSTGQSQGIYIQFLIAVINYISSINSIGKNAAVTGKTIFIDNPFGAAKDVYIWEPIFKMLKTNHVQLIVPARGVTPAITKMFDVNYILGQKMTGGRQQTVITDYRSQVDVSEMEYEPLKYNQGTFDFEHML